jgi:two-component system, OmpR family, sensor histidine kinase MtrB
VHRPVAPRRLRRRLAIAFILVAGILTGLLATGTFLLVRAVEFRDSLDRAERESRFGLNLAANLPPQSDLQQFVDAYEPRGIPAVLVSGSRRFTSDPSFDPPIPAALRELVGRGHLGYDRVKVGGAPYLVAGGMPPGSDSQLYLFFSEERLHADLGLLGRVLLIGWLAVILLASLVGWSVARRTLAPVGEASRAARSLAEGLLDTRLPVQAEDEFGAWAASFNEMADALEAKIRALSEAQARERRFTSDVAHELRTPLTALVGEASMLAEQLEHMPLEARRPAELLVTDVSRLRRLVEDLMEMSRFDAGRERVQVEPVDVASLVAAVIRSRGWDGTVALETEPVTIPSDRRRLERIVSNLVGNAVTHGGRDTAVRVGRDARGPFVEVSDRGGGIAPEHVPHLFERFFKADQARAGSGSGLGLAIAIENARLLGGDIDVWSEVGVGTRFTLRLP